MKASYLLDELRKMNITTFTGVPDSTLTQFCDGLNTYQGDIGHYVTANEGAAVGLAIGTYLSTGHPACVYMQNSGEGNIINPLASLANEDVYGVPMLFIIGWRGEPGVHDEPQHVYQGKITLDMLKLMDVSYTVIDADTTDEEMNRILETAGHELAAERQYAIVVKKGTFEKEEKYRWDNGNTLIREEVLGELLKMLPRETAIISTTGKISRELYEQSDAIYGDHDNLFMTVGGMGHASMIAFGVASGTPGRRVVCIDGDGAYLMHMGSSAFMACNAPENMVHIVINNMAHESVGGMPTACGQIDISEVAKSLGYRGSYRVRTMEELTGIREVICCEPGPVLIEIMVALGARADLGRPKESAADNKRSFMKFMNV